MKRLLKFSTILLLISLSACAQKQVKKPASNISLNKLTPEEKNVIEDGATEAPYKGIYTNNTAKGTYICKRCNAPLYTSESKFDSHCGWPSFDEEIKGSVKRFSDPDGMRTEIVCAKCNAHLGHVFLNEGFTNKNTRHCVNSISMVFVPAKK